MPLKRLADHPFVHERISTDGRLTGYQVKIRRKGYPPYTKSFDDLKQADAAVVEILNDRNHGGRRDLLASHRVTLGDVIDGAIKSISSDKSRKGRESEVYRLNAFTRANKGFCLMAMAHIGYDDWDDWKTERLEEVKAGTVRREMNLLMPIMRKAARSLHMLGSPLDLVDRPKVMDERVARFGPGEEKRLFAELRRSSHPFLLSAATFALETGARRSELLRIRWRDYESKRGTIYLSDAKNGRGRYILLTRLAQAVVESLPRGRPDDPIFDVSAQELKTAYEKARAQANMTHWRWHDFRHEAISRCFDAGWTSEQVMDFSGHVDPKSMLRYRHPRVDDGVARVRDMESRRLSGRRLQAAS